MAIPAKYPSLEQARRAGWFSRRHETSAEHEANRVLVNARVNAKFDGVARRAAERRARTSQEQLTLLDGRSGESLRERAKLQARIAKK